MFILFAICTLQYNDRGMDDAENYHQTYDDAVNYAKALGTTYSYQILNTETFEYYYLDSNFNVTKTEKLKLGNLKN